jgi:hypothetical protein
MLNGIAVCAATVFASMTFAVPSSYAAVYVRGAAMGDCPMKVAQDAMSVAEKACKQQGKEAVITYLSCTDGVAELHFACA